MAEAEFSKICQGSHYTLTRLNVAEQALNMPEYV